MSVDLKVKRGDRRPWNFTVSDADGAAMDLTGSTVEFTIREKVGGDDSFFDRDSSVDNDALIKVSDAEAGLVVVRPRIVDWNDVSNYGVYVGDFKITDAAGVVAYTNNIVVRISQALIDYPTGPGVLLFDPAWVALRNRGDAGIARAEEWLGELVAMGLDQVPLFGFDTVANNELIIPWIQDRVRAVGLTKWMLFSHNYPYQPVHRGGAYSETHHDGPGTAWAYSCPVEIAVTNPPAGTTTQRDIQISLDTSLCAEAMRGGGFEIATWHANWEAWFDPYDTTHAGHITACSKCGSLAAYLAAQTEVIDAVKAIVLSYTPGAYLSFWFEYFNVPSGSAGVPVYSAYDQAPAALEALLANFTQPPGGTPLPGSSFRGGFVFLSPYREVASPENGRWTDAEWVEMCEIVRDADASIAFYPPVDQSDPAAPADWGLDAATDALSWAKLRVALEITK